MVASTLSGFFTSLSLIIAIGAQNAFVLRQGLRQHHVMVVVSICALSDATLIALGIGGFNLISPVLPWLKGVMRWAGILFLGTYGALRFRAAYRGGEALLPANSPPGSLASVVMTCLVITWANPHVYLDTVMLLGSISSQYHPHELTFGMGAAFGSFVFFATLGFGARHLAPVFASVRAWIVLEILIGITMWSIALGLLLNA